MDRHNVSMNNSGRGARFLMESRGQIRIPQQFRPNDFNGDWPGERLIGSRIDCAHPSLTHTPIQPVTFRKKPWHVHAYQDRSLSATTALRGIETHAAVWAFAKILRVMLIVLRFSRN